MTHPHKPKRRQHAMAARQALTLCEAQLIGSAPEEASEPPRIGTRREQHHINAVTARAALRAAGLPPNLAAELRNRLRIAPEPEIRS